MKFFAFSGTGWGRLRIGPTLLLLTTIAVAPEAQSPRENAQKAFDRGYQYQTGKGIKRNLRFAIDAYLEAIKLDPSYGDAYYNFAQISFEVGRYDRAVWGYMNYLKYNPYDPQAEHDLGVVYNMQGNFDLAIQQYKKALAMKPDLAQAHYNLGNVYYAQKKGDMAIREWDRAIELDPENEVYSNRRERFARIERQKKSLLSPDVVRGIMWGMWRGSS